MSAPRDPATRATRLAANAALFAVLAWAVLFYVTTQLASVRAASPFADDPWDAVASYAAIFLPLVVGVTGVRSLRHRGPHLEPAIARRIRTGVTIALLTIGLNLVSDAAALLVVPTSAADGRFALIIGLVIVTSAMTLAAVVFLLQSRRFTAGPAASNPAEPDILDDLLGLARVAAGAVRPIKRPTERLVAALDRFLVTSAASPRRHRLVFGLLAAAAFGLAFSLWHGIAEGPWISLVAFLIFAALGGAGLLVIYLLALVPLRLIRPAR